jgi:hypothetical protein
MISSQRGIATAEQRQPGQPNDSETLQERNTIDVWLDPMGLCWEADFPAAMR